MRRKRWDKSLENSLRPPLELCPSIYSPRQSMPRRYNARVGQQFFEKESVVGFHSSTSRKETGAGTITHNRAARTIDLLVDSTSDATSLWTSAGAEREGGRQRP